MQGNKTVYLVRHGQSVDNVRPVFQSAASPLSEKGQEQAMKLAARLKHVDFDALISSPLPRAKQTAEAIGKATSHQVIYSDLFVESAKPSSTEGKTHEDESASKTFAEWRKSLYQKTMRVEDSENYSDMIERAGKALDYLLSRDEEKIAVVTHGFILRTMLAVALFDDHLNESLFQQIQSRFANENTGITVLEYRESYNEPKKWRLWTFNDHAHFAE